MDSSSTSGKLPSGVTNPVYALGDVRSYSPYEKEKVELDTFDKIPVKHAGSHESDSSDSSIPIEHKPPAYTERYSNKIRQVYTLYNTQIWRMIKILATLGWITYLIVACTSKNHSKEAIPVVALTVVCAIFISWSCFKAFIGNNLPNQQDSLLTWATANERIITLVLFLIGLVVIAAGVTASFLKDTKFGVESEQFISVGGYVLFPFILYVFSKYRTKIIWQPVIAGLVIQFCMGLFILKTDIGFKIFNGLGNFAQTFLNFIEAGVTFVFGPDYVKHHFAMKTMPIILYFSAVVSVLYYLGAMQWVIEKIGWLMYTCLGTSAPESMVAAGNIFIGQTESPLLIRPFLPDCTNSELMAIMAAGMGTIAGSVLGAYLTYGANAVYLITGSVMAAPCVLALSKIFYPETKKSKYRNFDEMEMEPDKDVGNIIEAIMKGAIEAIPLALNIMAILIAAMSIIAALDALLGYLGGLVNIEGLTLDLIFGYVFWPLTFMLGVEQQDITLSSQLIGTKVIVNEFIAYEKLSGLLKFRDAGCERGTWLSYRSEAIVTYSLCGFANLSSMGIVLGGLSEMAPKRRRDMSKLIVRALIVGCFTSFQNAAMSGFLINDAARVDKVRNEQSGLSYLNAGTTSAPDNWLVNCTDVGLMYMRNGCSLTTTNTTCSPVVGVEKADTQPTCCNMNETIMGFCENEDDYWPVSANCTLIPKFKVLTSKGVY